jgi:hypothetical protein
MTTELATTPTGPTTSQEATSTVVRLSPQCQTGTEMSPQMSLTCSCCVRCTGSWFVEPE